MATLELVIAIAIGLPFMALFLGLGVYACRILFSVIGVGVGSPLL